MYVFRCADHASYTYTWSSSTELTCAWTVSINTLVLKYRENDNYQGSVVKDLV